MRCPHRASRLSKRNNCNGLLVSIPAITNTRNATPLRLGDVFRPYRERLTSHQSRLTSHLKDLLVRAERIPVMLPNNAFHFVGVAGLDGFENLPMFFLSVW